MNYKETLDWMFGKLPMYQRVGAAAYKADLQQTVDLLNLLHNPQQNFYSVHIAGTNGKGSVSHMLASIFQEAGLKTGLYTSPHLKDFRERIRINGKMIAEEEVTHFIETYHQDFEKMQLSFFEMTVGMAFNYFSNEEVDIAIVETGMGGRLDSTNLVQPLVTIITNIGYDHMQYLGNTLASIASEKAGIIKPGIPVVIGETQLETKEVFEKQASELKAPLVFADQLFDVSKIEKSHYEYQYFDVWKRHELFLEAIEFPLLGHYQQMNIVTAIAAIDILQEHFGITTQHIRAGLAYLVSNTGLMGRWQILSRIPLTIADTGHNREGVKEIIAQLQTMQYKRLHFVFGVVCDKDITTILEILPRNAIYYFCKADIPRAMAAEDLANLAFNFGLNGKVYGSVGDAFSSARNAALPDDLVFVGGSTFVVAEIV